METTEENIKEVSNIILETYILTFFLELGQL